EVAGLANPSLLEINQPFGRRFRSSPRPLPFSTARQTASAVSATTTTGKLRPVPPRTGCGSNPEQREHRAKRRPQHHQRKRSGGFGAINLFHKEGSHRRGRVSGRDELAPRDHPM